VIKRRNENVISYYFYLPSQFVFSVLVFYYISY